MKILKNLKQIVYSACLYFTAAEFAILIFANAMGLNYPESGKEIVNFLNLSSSAVILLFAFIMSALNLIWKTKLTGAVKVMIHFIVSFATYFVIFVIIPGVYGNMAQIVVRSGLFAVLYFIIAFIALIISTIKRNRQADRAEYKNNFGKN